MAPSAARLPGLGRCPLSGSVSDADAPTSPASLASLASLDSSPSSSLFSKPLSDATPRSSLSSSVSSLRHSDSAGSCTPPLIDHSDLSSSPSSSWIPKCLVSTYSVAHLRPNVFPPGQVFHDLPADSASNSTTVPGRSFDLDPDFLPFPEDPHCLKHAEFGYDPCRSQESWVATQAGEQDQKDGSAKQDNSLHLMDQNRLNHTVWSYRCLWTSHFNPAADHAEYVEDAGYFTYLTTYFSYLLIFIIGHVRDFFGKRLFRESYVELMPHDGHAALNSDFGSFFTRRVKSRLDDCFSRPVSGSPGRTIRILDRTSLDHCFNFKFTHKITQALNVSSYNYLGFAQSKGSCTDAVEKTIDDLSLSSGGSSEVSGKMLIHHKAERLISKFLGVEDSILISQGFASNSTVFPCLVSAGCLIISDELNHASIRFGARLSGARVTTFKHNDMADLEKVLRRSISQGQPRKMRPWKKIMVVVEGIYSMEGSIVNLPRLLRLRDKYKFYVYLDEAHSIGALGPHGRGVCDYYGIHPSRIDVLMGTLTKSFGASGGYISGTKDLISHLRRSCHSSIYAEALSPPVVSQVISSMKLMMGSGPCGNSKPRQQQAPHHQATLAEPLKVGRHDRKEICDESMSLDLVTPLPSPSDLSLTDGQIRLKRLGFNARYLRMGLRRLGFIVVGDLDSPVVPLLVFQPGKLLLFSRLMLQRHSIVVVIVGYPATPLVLGRVRFCVSASHTKADIDRLLIATDEVGGMLGLRLGGRKVKPKSEHKVHSAVDASRTDHDDNRIWKVEEVIGRYREVVLSG